MTDLDVDMLDVDDVEKEQTPPKQEVIPPLRTIAHSIFVPLTIDITKPEEEPDRVQRLQCMLESIDYHHEGMKENLLYMFEREKRRMVMEAAEREVALGQQDRKPGIPRPEEDMIIRNMEAPANWNKSYNLTKEKLASYQIRAIPEGAPISVRDATVLGLLTMLERSLFELDALDNFMGRIKDKYLQRLAKEIETMKTEGKKPEEREQNGGNQ
ncbi:hypothetical protein QBC44DRAFT_280746 [Cladorrhinum sp. PSN332]|nr:hypothetical protein QBC44DRAFT_280746 [Cladorrhinum sp. PSN332]